VVGSDQAWRSDEMLVAEHLQGDPVAFDHLIERYSQRVYTLIYRYVLDRPEAQNLTQETFLRVFQALPGSRLDLPFAPWLFRIAVNLCRDRKRTHRTIPFSEMAAEDDDDLTGPESIPDMAPDAAEQLEAAELQEALRRAVLTLPEKYRVPITLYYNEHLSYEEIAAVLNLPVNTVRTHLLRAKEKLRIALSEFADSS
jgi:RNA polymerase sigma-70 factor (ECF subfamily)